MSKWNKNTDQKIRQSVESIEFPFEEQAWAKMESLLENKTNKAVIPKWQYGLGLLLVVLFASGFYAYVNGALMSNQSKLIISGVSDQFDGFETVSTNNSLEKVVLGNQANPHNSVPSKTPQFNTNSGSIQELQEEHVESRTVEAFPDIKMDETGLHTPLSTGGSNPIILIDEDSENSRVNEPIETELTKEEKKENRKNGRAIKKMLGKSYVKKKYVGSGFNPLPTYFGARFGTNVTYDVNSAESKFKLVNGFVLGLYFQYQLNNDLLWQLDFNTIDLTGYRILHDRQYFIDGQFDYDISVDMDGFLLLEVASVWQRSLQSGDNLEFGFFTGLVSSGSFSTTSSGNSENHFKIQKLSNYTFGPVIGYEHRIWNKLFLSARYKFGLKDITRTEFFDDRKRHRASRLQLSLKYQFNKNKEIINQ